MQTNEANKLACAHRHWQKGPVCSKRAHGRTASWSSEWSASGLTASVAGSLDFSGFGDFVVSVNASQALPSTEVELVMPMA